MQCPVLAVQHAGAALRAGHGNWQFTEQEMDK